MRFRVRVPLPNSGLLSSYGVRFHVLPSRRAASSLLLIGSRSRAVGRLSAGVLSFKPNNDAGLQFQILMCPCVGLRIGACRCGCVFLPLPCRAICMYRSLPPHAACLSVVSLPVGPCPHLVPDPAMAPCHHPAADPPWRKQGSCFPTDQPIRVLGMIHSAHFITS